MPDTLVVNASPLIFLGNAGRLDLLREIGAGRILIPQPVYDEITQTAHTDAASRAVIAAEWIERVVVAPIPSAIIEWDMGPGESAVVATAMHIAGARPVIDDLVGRRCALAFGLNVMGTIGIVIAAQRRGIIPDARSFLLELRASGMWLSDAVLERALRLADASVDRES